MTPSNPRVLVLAVLSFGLGAALAGCSDVDCSEIEKYNDAKLDKQLVAPPGITAPAVRDTHIVPGGAPAEGATGGGCMVKPPYLIGPPPDQAPQQPAPTPPTKP